MKMIKEGRKMKVGAFEGMGGEDKEGERGVSR